MTVLFVLLYPIYFLTIVIKQVSKSRTFSIDHYRNQVKNILFYNIKTSFNSFTPGIPYLSTE